MNVRIPTPLMSYTGSKSVIAHGATVDDILNDLDGRFPGIRFRIVDEQGRLRQHMRIFVGSEMTRDLTMELFDDVELTIMQALSGG